MGYGAETSFLFQTQTFFLFQAQTLSKESYLMVSPG